MNTFLARAMNKYEKEMKSVFFFFSSLDPEEKPGDLKPCQLIGC